MEWPRSRKEWAADLRAHVRALVKLAEAEGKLAAVSGLYPALLFEAAELLDVHASYLGRECRKEESEATADCGRACQEAGEALAAILDAAQEPAEDVPGPEAGKGA